jgi:hypothetical protein
MFNPNFNDLLLAVRLPEDLEAVLEWEGTCPLATLA